MPASPQTATGTHPHPAAHIPPLHLPIGFNAHHAALGAYFSFTFGHPLTRGGLAAQSGKPANQDLFIGVKRGQPDSDQPLVCLPYMQTRAGAVSAAAAFAIDDVAQAAHGKKALPPVLPLALSELERRYGYGTDCVSAPSLGLHFSVFTPPATINDPLLESPEASAAACLPAISAELVVDNTDPAQPATAVFGLGWHEGGLAPIRILNHEDQPQLGFAWRDQLGFLASAYIDDQPVTDDSFFQLQRFDIQTGLCEPNRLHRLGGCGAVAVVIPPGKRLTLRIALGVCLSGPQTTGLRMPYWYTRHYPNLLSVLSVTLDGYHPGNVDLAREADQALLDSTLNRDQQFLLAHAARSYTGNTQLLDQAGEPFWIVNEGEYCMINTLDLSVDQLFWEAHHSPWTLRNLLDRFSRHYAYADTVRDPRTGRSHPGGISFCHDMGVNNQFSPQGTSSYELPNLRGCFSHMTAEQLCNWVLIAATYVAATNDLAWRDANLGLIRQCFESLLNRSHTDPAKADGLIRLDSERCAGGWEITTYDSLDESLGQARDNLYMATKAWATLMGLAILLGQPDSPAPEPLDIADRLADAIAPHRQADNSLPAVLDPASPGYASRILPAIEGLVYPFFWSACLDVDEQIAPFICRDDKGTPARYARLINLLRDHTIALLSDGQRRNVFPDAGLRLSSSSANSWMSKIAITQFVARQIFQLNEHGQPLRQDDQGPTGWESSDAAHAAWQTAPGSAYWAMGDQMINGVTGASRYYPRCVTAWLWTLE